MNITGIIIGILIMAFITFFAVFSTREVIKTKKEMKKIEEAFRKEEEKTKTMATYSSKVNEIKNDEIDKVKEINNAKNKEDLRNIARANANANNDKLREQKESGKEANTSSKTGKKNTKSTGK